MVAKGHEREECLSAKFLLEVSGDGVQELQTLLVVLTFHATASKKRAANQVSMSEGGRITMKRWMNLLLAVNRERQIFGHSALLDRFDTHLLLRVQCSAVQPTNTTEHDKDKGA